MHPGMLSTPACILGSSSTFPIKILLSMDLKKHLMQALFEMPGMQRHTLFFCRCMTKTRSLSNSSRLMVMKSDESI